MFEIKVFGTYVRNEKAFKTVQSFPAIFEDKEIAEIMLEESGFKRTNNVFSKRGENWEEIATISEKER